MSRARVTFVIEYDLPEEGYQDGHGQDEYWETDPAAMVKIDQRGFDENLFGLETLIDGEYTCLSARFELAKDDQNNQRAPIGIEAEWHVFTAGDATTYPPKPDFYWATWKNGRVERQHFDLDSPFVDMQWRYCTHWAEIKPPTSPNAKETEQ